MHPLFQGKKDNSLQSHNEDIRFQAENGFGHPELRPQDVHGRPYGGHHRGHRGATAGHRFRYCLRCFARERHHHGHRGGFHDFRLRRVKGADRRPHGRVHHYRLWHHPAVRHARTHHRHTHGGRVPYSIGRTAAGHHHQIYSLPHRCGFHQRYRRHHLHHANQGPAGYDDGRESRRLH